MRVVVGRIGRTQGVRGEVTVEVRTDDPELRFAAGAHLFPVPTDGASADGASADGARVPGPAVLVSQGFRWQSGRLILTIEGVEDRDSAELLRDTVLEAEVDVLTQSEPDEFHDQALLGLAVRGPDGSDIGRVVDVLHLPGQDLLAMVPEGRSDQVLIPFVAALVPTVDVAGGFLVADLPEGLLPEPGDEPDADA